MAAIADRHGVRESPGRLGVQHEQRRVAASPDRECERLSADDLHTALEGEVRLAVRIHLPDLVGTVRDRGPGEGSVHPLDGPPATSAGSGRAHECEEEPLRHGPVVIEQRSSDAARAVRDLACAATSGLGRLLPRCRRTRRWGSRPFPRGARGDPFESRWRYGARGRGSLIAFAFAVAFGRGRASTREEEDARPKPTRTRRATRNARRDDIGDSINGVADPLGPLPESTGRRRCGPYTPFMAMAPTHAFVGLALADLAAGRYADARLRVAGALCAALPDADTLLMRFGGVAYEDPWGHRGITHGLPFAFALAVLVAVLFFRGRVLPLWRATLALFLAIASQGVLDAMTTGGLGVAFLAPFDPERFFAPWTPIPVAPLSVRAFFTEHGMRLFGWELLHLWLPVGVLLVAAHVARSVARGRVRRAEFTRAEFTRAEFIRDCEASALAGTDAGTPAVEPSPGRRAGRGGG